MNLLEVTYDDDGTIHYWRDKVEVPEDEWKQQHPSFRKQVKGKTSGREQVSGRSADSGVQRKRDQRKRRDDAEQS